MGPRGELTATVGTPECDARPVVAVSGRYTVAPTMSWPTFPRRLPAVVASFGLWSCGGGDLALPSGPGPQVEVVEGDEQVGRPGARLADPLIVRLVDEAGNGIPDRAVVWVVTAGGGTVNPATGTTDAEGFASAEWTLGPAEGPNRVDAQVPGIGSVLFTVTASDSDEGPRPSASRSEVVADPASIDAGTGTSAIRVTVRDGDGDPLAGATVSLQATGEGNVLTQPAGTTGPDGTAVGALQSTAPGEKVVTALVNGSIQVTQTAVVTVTGGGTLRIEPLEGDDQSAPAGSPVSLRPAVRVVDEQGAPVAGVAVTFTVTGGGGAVSGAARTTDGEGVARVGRWTLGSTPGPNTLEASAAGVEGSPVVFTAEGTSAASPVDRLVFLVPPRDVDEGETFTVRVGLVDAAGDVVPLSGIFIYIGLFPEGQNSPTNNDLGGERFENTEDGVAEFELSVRREGRYRLRALTDDLPELGPHGPEPYLYSEVFEVD